MAVARKTGKRVELDTATRMEMDADFSVREGGAAGESEPFEETNPLDELMRILSETPTWPLALPGGLCLCCHRTPSSRKHEVCAGK